ncbi:CoA transferase [Sphingobium sp. AS12]|uniref:CoA transferase n=1 Tax=Sphingobium sp. AS12 TaxID=2849495 RepID=UPI0020C900A3|nr:CoA transferase [Sphingobium sp. AS12]
MRPLTLPLAGWAEGELRAMGMPAGLSGAMLMGERAALNGFAVPGVVSAGGGCRLYTTRDGHVALTLARDDDRAMLPALFQNGELDPDDDAQIVTAFRACSADALVVQGRMLGLAIARMGEVPVSPPCQVTADGAAKVRTGPLLVVDLSALWAGPLAAHLIGLTGAQVVKVESRNRPDRMREGDPALFARINQDKANVALDLRDRADREALIALIRRADVVIEAARPRALWQLGIDADALVRAVPGLVWMTITGHGATGEAGDWIGFGDDASVAGGVSDALSTASGTIAFGGDACADPLTGIHAARLALERIRNGRAARMILSMSAIVAMALDSARRRDEKALMTDLQAWGAAQGQAFPATAVRPAGRVAAMGQDNAIWLARC